MKIAIVFGNDGSDVRLLKTCRSLRLLGHQVHLIGWNRRPDLNAATPPDGVIPHVIDYRVPTRRSTFLGQWAFTKHALSTLSRLRPETVIAVNEDNAIRVLPLYGSAYKHLVCDIYDSHIDRFSNHLLPIRTAAYSVSKLAQTLSDSVIVTDDRRQRCLGVNIGKSYVIGNFPEDPGEILSKQPVTGPLTIFVSGSLSKMRGLDTLIKVLETNQSLRIRAAGWFSDTFSENVFARHQQVEYLGRLTPFQSLEEAAKCDAVLAMYAPTNKNNIKASPNKIFDAMSVGRPVVINSEAEVSGWVTDNGLGFSCPYYDHSQFTAILEVLKTQRDSLNHFAASSRSLFQTGFSWESTLPIFKDLYGESQAA